jgi:hypothetical protein
LKVLPSNLGGTSIISDDYRPFFYSNGVKGLSTFGDSDFGDSFFGVFFGVFFGATAVFLGDGDFNAFNFFSL